jgi:hypothetical protein
LNGFQSGSNGLTFNLANLLGIRGAAPQGNSNPNLGSLLGTRSALPGGTAPAGTTPIAIGDPTPVSAPAPEDAPVNIEA